MTKICRPEDLKPSPFCICPLWCIFTQPSAIQMCLFFFQLSLLQYHFSQKPYVMRPFVQSGHIHKTPLKLRASSLFYLTHLLHLYHQLFIDVKRENILCVLDLVSFIKILATINLYYFQFE